MKYKIKVRLQRVDGKIHVILTQKAGTCRVPPRSLFTDFFILIYWAKNREAKMTTKQSVTNSTNTN